MDHGFPEGLAHFIHLFTVLQKTASKADPAGQAWINGDGIVFGQRQATTLCGLRQHGSRIASPMDDTPG